VRTISCPKCPAGVTVPLEDADSRGRVRLVCDSCGARVLVKVNPRALKLSPEIPLSTANQGFVHERHFSGMWALVVYKLGASEQNTFRRALLSMPRFRGNPNKLHDETAALPYVFHGLKRKETVFLNEELRKLHAEYESGPLEWLLDGSMTPLPEQVRGPLPNIEVIDEPEVEVLSAVPGSSWEIRYDGGRTSRVDLPVPPEELLTPASEEQEQPGDPASLFDAQGASYPSPAANSRQTDTPRPPKRRWATPPQSPWNNDLRSPHPGAPLDGANLSGVADEVSRIVAQRLDSTDEAVLSIEFEQADMETTGAEQPKAANSPPELAELSSPPTLGNLSASRAGTAIDDDFAIVSINKLPGHTVHIGTLHTTISVSANELGVGFQTSIDGALAGAHNVLQQRAQKLGGTAIVGLRVTQSAIPTKDGWMLLLVLTGTAVA